MIPFSRTLVSPSFSLFLFHHRPIRLSLFTSRQISLLVVKAIRCEYSGERVRTYTYFNEDNTVEVKNKVLSRIVVGDLRGKSQNYSGSMARTKFALPPSPSYSVAILRSARDLRNVGHARTRSSLTPPGFYIHADLYSIFRQRARLTWKSGAARIARRKWNINKHETTRCLSAPHACCRPLLACN